MSVKTGFITNGGTPFAYLEDSNGASVAAGLDSAGSDVFKISVSTSTGAIPTTSPQFLIDPAANGNVTLKPNGSGKVVASYMGAGVVQSSSAGVLTSSEGTDGQLLIGSSTGAPAWANISGGAGITITNGHNTISIAASGSVVLETITGNTGGAISPTAGNINIVTANSNVKFAGSGSTETLDFGPSTNLALGSALPSLTSGTNNTGLGKTALAATISGEDMTAIGYLALENNTSGNSNTAIGSQSLLTLNNSAAGHGYNTALGAAAGFSLATGSYNTLMGVSAGLNYTGAESSNILINHDGILGESNTLRIGATTGAGNLSLTSAYICGIAGVNVGSVATVVTENGDQLGTAVIAGGTNVSIGTSANTITINATGAASFAWNDITGSSATMAVNNGYVADNAGVVSLTLPSVAIFGSIIEVTGGTSGLNTGSWKIVQPAGVTIHYGTQNTTTGAGGSLQATKQYDSIRLVCVVANTDWVVAPGTQGNITVV